MRFAITGCDRYIRVFEEFLHAGWEPVKLFTCPSTDPLSANTRITKMAVRRNLPVQQIRMSDDDLRDLRDRGCDVLIIASYDWRIGNWQQYFPYAINFHPSPLPLGRGPYPLVKAILDSHTHWAVTCHKVAAQFDSGDILCAENFALDADETHDSLNLKLQMASGRLAKNVAKNFVDQWNNATPQINGEYWPLFNPRERTLDFSQSVEAIKRTLRAFGSLECFAYANGEPIYVRRAIGWTETHNLTPATVAHVDNQTLVIAARDGYIALQDWGLIPPQPAPVQAQTQNPPAN
jgi:methionyl-tRNA formyltransferase